MKDWMIPVSVPMSMVIMLVGIALLVGADPWIIVKGAAICLPIIAYAGFSIFTVLWAMRVGQVGLTQEMTLQAKFYFYHGMAVVLTIVLAAAGSFVVLFATLIGGILGHGPA